MKHVCQRVCTYNKKLFTNLNSSKDLGINSDTAWKTYMSAGEVLGGGVLCHFRRTDQRTVCCPF
jgi:hypothetical protein